MLESVPELEVLSNEDLNRLMEDALHWKSWSLHEQYHSELYALTSRLSEIYNARIITITEVVDMITEELFKRG